VRRANANMFDFTNQTGVTSQDIYSETCEMGVLDAVLGNATEAESPEVETLVVPILVRGEKLTHAFVVGLWWGTKGSEGCSC